MTPLEVLAIITIGEHAAQKERERFGQGWQSICFWAQQRLADKLEAEQYVNPFMQRKEQEICTKKMVEAAAAAIAHKKFSPAAWSEAKTAAEAQLTKSRGQKTGVVKRALSVMEAEMHNMLAPPRNKLAVEAMVKTLATLGQASAMSTVSAAPAIAKDKRQKARLRQPTPEQLQRAIARMEKLAERNMEQGKESSREIKSEDGPIAEAAAEKAAKGAGLTSAHSKVIVDHERIEGRLDKWRRMMRGSDGCFSPKSR